MSTVKMGVYKHFKGMEYTVLGIAKHSETLEDMVVYICNYENPRSRIWVRPLTMFLEVVEYNGEQVTRFTYIG